MSYDSNFTKFGFNQETFPSKHGMVMFLTVAMRIK